MTTESQPPRASLAPAGCCREGELLPAEGAENEQSARVAAEICPSARKDDCLDARPCLAATPFVSGHCQAGNSGAVKCPEWEQVHNGALASSKAQGLKARSPLFGDAKVSRFVERRLAQRGFG
jgi:hypothetical protein